MKKMKTPLRKYKGREAKQRNLEGGEETTGETGNKGGGTLSQEDTEGERNWRVR